MLVNIFKLANIVDKKMSAIHTEVNLCTKLISPKSHCQSCIDHCPTKSIKIEKGSINIDDQCMECGICSTICSTNAILMTKPSLSQLVKEIVQKGEQNNPVYIHCERTPSQDRNAVKVSMPCLGSIPMEAWVSILQNGENLSIFLPNNHCNQCEISTGESIWQSHLQLAESMTGKKMRVSSKIEVVDDTSLGFNSSRRAFFHTLFKEMKATNVIAVREMLGNTEVQSYQDKIVNTPTQRIKKEWEVVSNGFIEKLTNEATHGFFRKRKMLMAELKKSETLRNREDTRLPVISPQCDFCGACSILCPTNALNQETIDGETRITLIPHKCVDCRLCEEICFSKEISLKAVHNGELLVETKLLAMQKEKNL